MRVFQIVAGAIYAEGPGGTGTLASAVRNNPGSQNLHVLENLAFGDEDSK